MEFYKDKRKPKNDVEKHIKTKKEEFKSLTFNLNLKI